MREVTRCSGSATQTEPRPSGSRLFKFLTPSQTRGASAWLNDRTGAALAAGALIVLTMAVYYPALETRMVADDFTLVGTLSFSDASRYFQDTFGMGRNEYRPVTALSYAVDRWLWGSEAHGYHFTNLILHALTGILFFVALRALTAEPIIALIAAALFILHPINHSRVIWISARDASVSAVFLLAAVLLHIYYRKRNSAVLRILAVFAAGLSLLSYEGAVTVPVLLFGTDLLFFTSGPLLSRTSKAMRATAPFWAVAIAYIVLWQLLFAGRIGAYELAASPIGALENYGRLVYTLFYGHRRVVFGIAYAVLFGLCFRVLLSRARLTAFSIMLVIVSFIPFCIIDGFASRFAYPSALGFSTILAMCIVHASTLTSRTPRLAVMLIAILLCGYYAVEDRKILAEWNVAGQIAQRIPEIVHHRYPTLPPGTILVFRDIPTVYRRSNRVPDRAARRDPAPLSGKG